MAKIPHDPDEILAIVDENDNVVGKATRREVHQKGLRHREVGTAIINSKGQMLIQTREDNGKLTFSAAGHFPYTDNYLKGAVREAKEELGITINPNKFKEIFKPYFEFKNDYVINNRFYKMFIVRGDYLPRELKIDPEEVHSVKFFDLVELKSKAETNPDQFTEALRYFIFNR